MDVSVTAATWRRLKANLAETPSRFPLPFGAAVLASAVGISLSHNWNWWSGEAEATRLFVFLVLSFFVLLAAKLFSDGHAWSWPRHLALAALGVGLLALRVFSLPPDSLTIFKGPLLFLAPCLVLLVTVAPFIGRSIALKDGTSTNVAFWDFNRAGWLGAGLALVAALILGTGISSAFYAIETLFTVSLPASLYSDLWVLCLALLWPWLTLAQVPRQLDATTCDIPWGLRTLALYILVPLVFVYLVILYGYMAKLGLSWELPKGQVATLVSIYAGIGVVTYLLIYPFRRRGGRIARIYDFGFFPALFLPIFVLFVALGHRIADYGVTEARYAVGLLGIWLLFCALYTVFTVRSRLVLVPLSLAFLLAAASVGPWGAIGLSTRSQVAQLETLLSANGLLENGRIRPTEAPLPFETTKRISSIVAYLVDSGRQDKLSGWFAGNDLASPQDANSAQLVAAMGLSYVDPWQDQPSFSYHVPQDQVFRVSGFDLLAQTQLNAGYTQSVMSLDGGQIYTLAIDEPGRLLTVTTPTGKRLEIDLVAAIDRLRTGEQTDYARTRAMTLGAEDDNLRVRLYLENMTGLLEADGPRVTYAQGILLVGDIRRQATEDGAQPSPD